MTITETNSKISHKYLMGKSKSDLAFLYLSLLDHIQGDSFVSDLIVAIEDHLEWMETGKVDGVGFDEALAKEALIAALAKIKPLMEPTRCPLCDWPLAESADNGCVIGNCSYRPDEGSDEYRRIQQLKTDLLGAP